MKKIAIIQARMGSTRLPGKVLMHLQGKPVLAWVVDAAKAITHIDDVVVATSCEAKDDDIVTWCKDNNTSVFRGSEQHVLQRYYNVAQSYGLESSDLIMRLTADCPLLDPQICGEVLDLIIRTQKDYVNNIGNPRAWTDGLDCEVFTYEALEISYDNAKEDKHKEHVTLYIREHPEIFSALSLHCPISGMDTYRWTLDTQEDYEHIQNLTSSLVKKFGDNKPFYSYHDVLQIEKGMQSPSIGNTHGLKNSAQHLKRALKTIPTASQTFSKSYIQHIKGISPFFIDRGKGAYVWDIDDNQYIDYLAALLPVLLGYCDDDVDEAIKAQLSKGISFSLATILEAELAELLIDLIPSAEMVRFGKNGSDVTSAAIRLARAYTGYEQIAVCGYHGWHDWYISTTPKNLGVPQSTKDLTDTFTFNDIDSLKQLLSKKKYAAIILEAEGAITSKHNFLEDVRELATMHGTVLIFDEIVSGFRSSLGGIQEQKNIIPDLSCFGKAMGNGMPISAIVGKKEIMSLMDKIFFSSTFGGETLSIIAAITCIKKYKENNGVTTIQKFGAQLKKQINAILHAQNINHIILIDGEDWWPVITISHQNSTLIRTLLRQELARNGIIQGNSFNLSLSHCNADILDKTLIAWNETVSTLAEYLKHPTPEQFLADPQSQIAFQVRQ